MIGLAMVYIGAAGLVVMAFLTDAVAGFATLLTLGLFTMFLCEW